MIAETIQKIVPTDAQLNEAMARALGMKEVGTYRYARMQYTYRDGRVLRCNTWRKIDVDLQPHQEILEEYNETALMYWGFGEPEPVKDYCNDRNTLPEIWAAIEKAKVHKSVFFSALNPLVNPNNRRDIANQWWAITTATPKQHVIAALKALNAWPGEWEG
jgi:hypothetical protein